MRRVLPGAEVNVECRCPGFEGDAGCDRDATEEDGLCDTCRCEHGCCVDHGHPKVGVPFEDWMQRDWQAVEPAVLAAWRRWGDCRDAREVPEL